MASRMTKFTMRMCSRQQPFWRWPEQPDGKISGVGGDFYAVQQCERRAHHCGLDGYGTLDRQNSTGTGADVTVATMAVQKDGAILIAGNFSNVNGQPYAHLARLNPDGTVDVTFAIGAGADKNVRCVAVQLDGKILVAGDFTSFGNVPCRYIVRLNADGSVDKSFDDWQRRVRVPLVASRNSQDEKIVLGGNFTRSFSLAKLCGNREVKNGTATHPTRIMRVF